MGTESKFTKLSDELAANRFFEAPGQLLVWAAENYRKVEDELSVESFSHLLFERLAQCEGSEDAMRRLVEYAGNMGFKPPKDIRGFQFRASWCLGAFIAGDLRGTAH